MPTVEQVQNSNLKLQGGGVVLFIDSPPIPTVEQVENYLSTNV